MMSTLESYVHLYHAAHEIEDEPLQRATLVSFKHFTRGELITIEELLNGVERCYP